jgi:uncharacterized protein YjbJ (UPF0337 family)
LRALQDPDAGPKSVSHSYCEHAKNSCAWQNEPGAVHAAEVPTQRQEFEMNKDQIKGAAKDIGGKIQEEAGKLVGSKDQQAKGLMNQVKGKAQQQVGNLEEAVKDAKA